MINSTFFVHGFINYKAAVRRYEFSNDFPQVPYKALLKLFLVEFFTINPQLQ